MTLCIGRHPERTAHVTTHPPETLSSKATACSEVRISLHARTRSKPATHPTSFAPRLQTNHITLGEKSVCSIVKILRLDKKTSGSPSPSKDPPSEPASSPPPLKGSTHIIRSSTLVSAQQTVFTISALATKEQGKDGQGRTQHESKGGQVMSAQVPGSGMDVPGRAKD